MTLLASWAGVDTHGVSSTYIVSDSRFTWNTGAHFDNGKKVFTSKVYPEIFGYAGDVLFPSVVLSQIIEMIDQNILLSANMRCDEKNSIIFEKICHTLIKYPTNIGNNIIQIIHISRDTEVKGYPHYHQYLLTWSKDGGFKSQKIAFPNHSDILMVLGSGKSEFKENYARFQSSTNKSTSRNVFHCFLDTLKNIKDPFCGGPPQLVGIYRKPLTYGKNFGILYNNKRYLLGMEIPKDSSFKNIEWRNELFEVSDGHTKTIARGAMIQPDDLRR